MAFMNFLMQFYNPYTQQQLAPKRCTMEYHGIATLRSRLGLRLAQYHHHPGAQRTRSETDSLEEQRRVRLRLAQSHHHPGAQRPRSETDHLEEQRRVRHCSSKLYKELNCLYSKKDRKLKKWCAPLSAFNPFVPSVPKTMTPNKS